MIVQGKASERYQGGYKVMCVTNKTGGMLKFSVTAEHGFKSVKSARRSVRTELTVSLHTGEHQLIPKCRHWGPGDPPGHKVDTELSSE